MITPWDVDTLKFHINIGSGHFQYFWSFQKCEYFWGYGEIVVIFWGLFTKLHFFGEEGGHFYTL